MIPTTADTIEHRITTTAEFLDTLKNTWDAHYLFRGEDACDYTLRPKFGRWAARNSQNNLESEQFLLREFKRFGMPHLDRMPGNDWEWLALGQHFGLATRFLDWTENPLIAAYFATHQCENGMDRVMYALKVNSLQEADESLSPFSIPKPVIYRPKHISTRISSQAAVFTAHPTPEDAFTTDGLVRWVIDDKVVIELNVLLMTFGIHDAYIFPGLDGVARHLNDMTLRTEHHE